MTSILQDFRYSLRTLRKSPGFVISGVLALAFGIGINSMVFTLLNAVTLRPIPVRDAGEIITVYQVFEGRTARRVHGTQSLLSFPEYAAYRDQSHVLAGIVAYAGEDVTLNGPEMRGVVGQLVTCNYFQLLTGSVALGRGFADEECRARGANPVVVLSHVFWERHFAADRGALGQTISLNGNRFTIVGIAPEGFRGASLESADLWAPISMQEQWMPGQKFLDDANLSWLHVVGRMKPGASLSEARTDLGSIAARLDQQNPGRTTMLVVDRATLMNVPRGRRMMLSIGAVVLAAVSLVLLIACANLANLLLARALVREKEVAVRLAIGASRFRLIRQLLTESLLVSLAGGGLGLLLAWRLLGIAYPFVAARLPEEAQSVTLNFAPDIRILSYSLLLCIVTAVGFGLLPAWQASKLDLNTVLKGGVRQRARNRFRSALVTVQVAVSVVLLIATGLLARGVYASQAIDPGIRTEGIVVATLDLTRQGYDEPRATEFHRRLSERLVARFGAEQVALADPVPLSGGRRQNSVTIEGRGEPFDVAFGSVSPGYFQLTGIPIVAGRGFAELDLRSDSPAAVVSESTARRFWPDQDAIGKRFGFQGTDEAFTVVGVAKDVRGLNLSRIDETFVYFTGAPNFYRNTRILARSAAGYTAVATVIRDEIQGIDPNLLARIGRLEDNLAEFRLPSQVTGILGLVLGIAGLLLAALGLYAVMSYGVAQRTREIGIRMSLGADAGRVVRMILSQGMWPVAIGVAIGLAGSAAVSRVLSSLLFGVSPIDPFVYAAVCILLGGVACLAAYGPARRASRIDPMTALRGE